MSGSSYPEGFGDWPLERRDEFFAASAIAYRERKATQSRSVPAGPDAYGVQAPFAPFDEREKREDNAAPLEIISAADFAGVEPPLRPWIVPETIPDRTVTIMGGDGAVGKSTLLLQLAICVVAGREWIGKLPESGGVLFLSAEDDRDELHRRIDAIASGLDLPLAELGDFHLVLLAGRDAVLAAPQGKSAAITPTAVWRSLVDNVSVFQPRLLILDTLADIFGGNENARPEARQFVGMLRGLAIDHNCAVVVAAHPSLTGMATGTGTSGSTAWNNSVRSRLYLELVKNEDGREIDGDLRLLRVMKANYSSSGAEIPIRWRDGCFVVEGPAGGFDKLAAQARAESVFLDLLALLTRQNRDVSPNVSRTYAPAVFAALPNAQGIGRQAFADAMERLLSRGEIRVDTVGPASKQRSKLVIAERRGVDE